MLSFYKFIFDFRIGKVIHKTSYTLDDNFAGQPIHSQTLKFSTICCLVYPVQNLKQKSEIK